MKPQQIQLFLGVLLFFAILSAVACESRSGKRQVQHEKPIIMASLGNGVNDTLVTLRGKNLISNVIMPVTVKASEMVYRPLDTVWVYMKDKSITTNRAWKRDSSNSTTDDFQAFVLYSKN